MAQPKLRGPSDAGRIPRKRAVTSASSAGDEAQLGTRERAAAQRAGHQTRHHRLPQHVGGRLGRLAVDDASLAHDASKGVERGRENEEHDERRPGPAADDAGEVAAAEAPPAASPPDLVAEVEVLDAGHDDHPHDQREGV